MRRRNFHIVVNCACANIQRPSENIRKTQNIVDLVGVITAACGHDRIVANRLYRLWCNFRIWVGHGENDRVYGHAFHHFGCYGALDRQPKEDVSTDHCFLNCPKLRVDRDRSFPLVHALVTTAIDHAFAVSHDDVFTWHAHRFEQIDAG